MKYFKRKSQLIGKLDVASGVFTGKLVAELHFLEDKVETRRQPIDRKGKFLFELDEETADRLTGWPVKMTVCSQQGAILASTATTIPKGGTIKNIRLSLPGDESTSINGKSAALDSKSPHKPFSHKGIPGHHLTKLARVLEHTGKSSSLQVPAWINRHIDDIDEASWIAHRILNGEERLLSTFGSLIERPKSSPDRPLAFRSSLGENFGRRCFVPPTVSFNIGIVGLILEEYDPENDWPERTINFVSERVQPLDHLYETALLVNKGELPPQALTAWTGDRRYPEEPLTRPIITPQGRGDVPLPSRDPEFPLEERPCRNYWRDCIRDIQQSGMITAQSRPKTTDIGKVTPELACGGQETEVEIHSKQGVDFGSGSSGSTLRFAEKRGGSREITPDSWSPDRIRVTLPAGAHSGHFYFERAFSWQGLAEGCSGLLLRGVKPRGVRLRNVVAFLDRHPRLDPGEELHNKIELVQPPVVENFTADGDETVLVTEACTAVTVAWRVTFGNPSTAGADDLSLDRIQVSILEGSTVVASDLDHEGSMVLEDRQTRQLTLKAETRVGGTICGEDFESLTISRVEMLHLEFPDDELKAGTGMSAKVSRSCAFSDASVVSFSTDSDLISVADSVTIPAGQREADFEIEAAQSGCAHVSLLAESPNHQSDQGSLFVYEQPTISSFAPQAITACTVFDLQITGSCFADGQTRVFLSKGTESQDLEVLSVSGGGNLVRCRAVSGVSPGEWSVSVKSRGLKSSPITLKLEATPPQPEINQFSVYHPILGLRIEPCVNQDITLEWDVQYGSHLKIIDEATGDVVVDRTLTDPCGADTGTATHTINSGRTFKIEVSSHDPDAPLKSDEVSIFETRFGVGDYESIKVPISDFSDDTFALWHQKLVPLAQPELVGTASAEGQITHTLDDCDKYEFRLLSQNAVEAYNEDPNSLDDDQRIDDPNDPRAFSNGAVWAVRQILIRGRSGEGTYNPGDIL